VFLVCEKRGGNYFVNIIFIFANRLFLSKEFRFEKVFVLLFIFGWKRWNCWWLYLSVDDLIYRQISILIFILPVSFFFFFSVELFTFLHSEQLLVSIGVIFWVVL